MKFDLYVELGFRALDTSVLDLLRFPSGVESQASRPEFSARWWARGKTKRMKSPDREKIIEKVSQTGVNQLELKWHAETAPQVAGLRLIDGCLNLFPSPMSHLWAEVPIHRLKAQSEEVWRRNFRNKESVLTREHKAPYPSTLECFLTMDVYGEALGESKLQELSVKWICAVTPKALTQHCIFGYGCVHGTCRRMGMLQSLGFPEIDELGEKFENLYPILIGSRKSCEALAAELESISSVTSFSDESPSSIISIEPDQIQSAINNTIVGQWLVPRPPRVHRDEKRAVVVPPSR